MSAHQPIEPERQALEMWVVYDHPKDSPDLFVARKWSGELPTNEVMTAQTVEPLRRKLADLGLTCIGRQPGDDPAIVEVWL